MRQNEAEAVQDQEQAVQDAVQAQAVHEPSPVEEQSAALNAELYDIMDELLEAERKLTITGPAARAELKDSIITVIRQMQRLAKLFTSE